MARERVSTRLAEYRKEAIMFRLKETRELITQSLDDFQAKLAKWKEEAPGKFAKFVESYEGTDQSSYHSGNFAPPMKPDACRDWRVQALNRAIIRIEAMEGEIIKLPLNDPLWEYVNYADCL